VFKKKLLYRFEEESRNTKSIAEELIETILSPAVPTTSCWWSKMKTRTDGFRSIGEAVVQKQKQWLLNGTEPNLEEGATAKTCPGIINLLKNSFLVKSPVSADFTLDSIGNYRFNVSDGDILGISVHPANQFIQEDNQFFKNKMAIKFSLKVVIKTDDFGYMLLDPTYHNKSDFLVPPGMIDAKYGNIQQLNVIAFIELPGEGDTKTISIKEGDVLAYLVPLEPCKVTFSEDNFTKRRFNRGHSPKHNF
jgi:hypothetical protein